MSGRSFNPFRRKEKPSGYDGAIKLMSDMAVQLRHARALAEANSGLALRPGPRKNMEDMVDGLEKMQAAIDGVQVEIRGAIDTFRKFLGELKA